MRIGIFTIIASIFISCNVFSTEIDAVINYKVLKFEDNTVVKLTILLNDTLQNKTVENHSNNAKVDNNKSIDALFSELAEKNHKPGNTKTDEGFLNVKHQIKGQVDKNGSLGIYIKRPDYIDQIIGLINNQPDKDEAIKIFNDNNFNNVIQNSLKHSTTIVNGKMNKNVTLILMVPITVRSKTTLSLEPLIIEYQNKVYKTEDIDISLE